MVLVAVGEDDALDAVGVLAQVGEVGEDEVDAGHVGVGEHQPAVDDEDAAVDLEAEAVPADLPEPAEEDDANRARARPRGYRPRQAARGSVARNLVERGVLLAGVDPVLELDHAELGEPVAEPAVGGVEEPELLAVRHDLREQHRLEDRHGRARSELTWIISCTSTPSRSHTSCCRNRSRIRTAASNANS